MSAALIKFVQGANTPPGGQALQGVTGVLVTCANNDNVGPPATVSWFWEMLDVPPGSSVPTGVMGTTSTVQFTPDLMYGYRLRLTTVDAAGNTSVDIRTVLIPNASGFIIPPFGAADNELNINGQTRGWAPFMEAWLAQIGSIATPSPAPAIALKMGLFIS